MQWLDQSTAGRAPENEAGGDGLDEQKDKEEAEQRSTASAHVVHEAILMEGREELERPTSALAWSGLAAGLSMGFSLVAEGLLRVHLPDTPWRPLVAKLGYSVGFLFVVLGRQQLFTENTLTAILPLLDEQHKGRTLVNVIRLWAVVLAANLVGAVAFAYVAARTTAFDEHVRAAFLDIGKEAMRQGPWTVLVRGIFAGWLIALMVWLLPVAETARVGVIVIVTYVVGLAQFSHIIAGAVETSYVVIAREAGVGRWLGGWVLPTLAGNVIGGVSLVAALNHAQVVARGSKGK